MAVKSLQMSKGLHCDQVRLSQCKIGSCRRGDQRSVSTVREEKSEVPTHGHSRSDGCRGRGAAWGRLGLGAKAKAARGTAALDHLGGWSVSHGRQIQNIGSEGTTMESMIEERVAC